MLKIMKMQGHGCRVLEVMPGVCQGIVMDSQGLETERYSGAKLQTSQNLFDFSWHFFFL